MVGVEGRVALVTGAGSEQGIGFATARLLRAKSEEASYITGQLIVVDGGNTIQEYKVAL